MSSDADLPEMELPSVADLLPVFIAEARRRGLVRFYIDIDSAEKLHAALHAAEAEADRLKADRAELLPLLENLVASMMSMQETLALLTDIVRTRALAPADRNTT